jgi:hypothetical protein
VGKKREKLEAAIKQATAELDAYAQNILDEGKIVGSHKDVARRLKSISKALNRALPAEPGVDLN